MQEIDKLLRELRDRLLSVKSTIQYAGDYFRALALAECYNKLIEFADERTQQHPEVQRVPELRSILLLHLISNAERHIDVRTERIFNPLLLGGPKSLRDWQEAGFRTKRTASNYNRRLRYWKAIYDEAPIINQVKVPSGNEIFGAGGSVYQSRFSTKKVALRVKDLEGNISHQDVSYEDVIHNRNANYSATSKLVPWWEVLNYGSTFAGLAGYPNTAGLHFVEDAEKLVPATLQQYLGMFDRFINDALDRTERDPISNIETWVASNRTVFSNNKYIPTADLARVLTFGVPF